MQFLQVVFTYSVIYMGVVLFLSVLIMEELEAIKSAVSMYTCGGPHYDNQMKS